MWQMPSGIKIKFYTHTHTLMEFNFFFWSLSLCSQIQTVTHIYFLSIATELETVKDIKHLWDLRTVKFCALELIWDVSYTLWFRRSRAIHHYFNTQFNLRWITCWMWLYYRASWMPFIWLENGTQLPHRCSVHHSNAKLCVW